MTTHILYFLVEKFLNDSIRMMCFSQILNLSYKTINRYRVNPKVDVLLESLFIQFHSRCLNQNLINDKALFIFIDKFVSKRFHLNEYVILFP